VGTCQTNMLLQNADMLQGCVAGTCSRDQIAELEHVFQGHVAATHPLVCAGTFSLTQHEMCLKFSPATCRTEFNSLNFMGHVTATGLWVRRHDHCLSDCATCPCSNTDIWANRRLDPYCKIHLLSTKNWPVQCGLYFAVVSHEGACPCTFT